MAPKADRITRLRNLVKRCEVRAKVLDRKIFHPWAHTNAVKLRKWATLLKALT